MTGGFFAAFDRDAPNAVMLEAALENGATIGVPIAIAPRDWNIERVNVARRSGGASESFMRIRRPELAQIVAARAVESDTDGWRQDFLWPVKGRISGRFGSQRIYRGEPGSYHSGLDIATGESGTPFVSPADGVVVLATTRPFSLEGNLLIIDHGNGLNSAFLHASKIAVRTGRRGETRPVYRQYRVHRARNRAASALGPEMAQCPPRSAAVRGADVARTGRRVR